ncbi:hypothetical protein [Actinoalloteichus hymeniacidonis]|uniref:hypothetical protein n=1 Tax=Actinoalloteichus hymeniacidonis TaxID=340345 RepID=UPI000853E45E|nr:hypothetical protein [Actinoalloteichus hymeniacidonis]MBB5907846.1 hypothetical protein [Actinoalloteichus hymeniacidonis]
MGRGDSWQDLGRWRADGDRESTESLQPVAGLRYGLACVDEHLMAVEKQADRRAHVLFDEQRLV